MKTFKQFLNARTPSIKVIADKHNKSVEYINSQLDIGIKVELEHSTDRKVAREIALDHLNERPDYYQRLKKVEQE